MTEQKKPQGFAAISDKRRREIASQGGKTAHSNGTAHKWDSEAARAAGLKGAATRAAKKKAVQS